MLKAQNSGRMPGVALLAFEPYLHRVADAIAF
jgi:hypothetical protein